MKKFTVLLSLLLALGIGSAQEEGSYTYASIVDFVEITEGFSTLNTAFRGAGLASRYKNSGSLTLFAPSDAAFESLSSEELNDLLENPGRLTSFLNGYLVPSRVSQSDLVAEIQRSGRALLRTLAGTVLEVTLAEDEQLVLNGATRVQVPDIAAQNGSIFVLDSLLSTGGRGPGLAPLPSSERTE